MVKIVKGKKGWHLKVNDLYISWAGDKEIKAISSPITIPCGATEWVSIKAIRNFWKEYFSLIIASTARTYQSYWGTLILIDK